MRPENASRPMKMEVFHCFVFRLCVEVADGFVETGYQQLAGNQDVDEEDRKHDFVAKQDVFRRTSRGLYDRRIYRYGNCREEEQVVCGPYSLEVGHGTQIQEKQRIHRQVGP